MMSRTLRWVACVASMIAGAAIAQTAPAPATAATVLPLDQFTRNDEFGTLKLSPDGEYVALSLAKAQYTSLVFIDLRKNLIAAVVQVPDRLSVSEFHWVSKTRLIYMTARRLPGRRYPVATGEIYATDRDGTRQSLLYGMSAWQSATGTKRRTRDASHARSDLLSSLRDDDRQVLIAEYPYKVVGDYVHSDPNARPRYSRLDVHTGMKDELGTSPLAGGTLLVDTHDQVRLAVGTDERGKYSVSFKRDAASPWSAFDLPGFEPETIVPQRFSTDDRSVFFTGQREGDSFAALYKIELATAAVTKIAAFDDTDVRGVITDFADNEVVGIYGSGDRPANRWLVPDDPTAKLYESLQRAFPNQSVEITSSTYDGRLAVAFVSSDVNPGEYYLFNTWRKTADFLRASRSWIDPRLMRPKEPIQVAARDGTVLHGYLTRPAAAGMHPMVVLPHGGPHAVRDDRSFDSVVQLFANRGYSVLQINFRGSDGYGAAFREAGFREWGGRMQDDVTDATRWAIGQNLVAADRICILGTDYGGYAALMGAVREPKLYRCTIGMAGWYDLELMLNSPETSSIARGAYLDRVLGNDHALLRARSPVYNAQSIEAPVLLIHGKSDWRADYDQATRMKAALEKNRKPVEWMALDGEGHGIYDEASRREVYERVLAFLDRNLMPLNAASRR